MNADLFDAAAGTAWMIEWHSRAAAGLPVRLQLERRKGFDLQALSRATNGLPAIVVTRAGLWGNCFRIGKNYHDPDAYTGPVPRNVEPPRLVHINGPMIATDFYRRLALRLLADGTIDFSPLKGANLACTCALGRPCHADVQLDLANR